MSKHHRVNLITAMERVCTLIFELKEFEVLSDTETDILDCIKTDVETSTKRAKSLIEGLSNTPAHIPTVGNEIEGFSWEKHDRKAKIHTIKTRVYKLQKELEAAEGISTVVENTNKKMIVLLDNAADKLSIQDKLVRFQTKFKMNLADSLEDEIRLTTKNVKALKEEWWNSGLDEYGYLKEVE